MTRTRNWDREALDIEVSAAPARAKPSPGRHRLYGSPGPIAPVTIRDLIAKHAQETALATHHATSAAGTAAEGELIPSLHCGQSRRGHGSRTRSPAVSAWGVGYRHVAAHRISTRSRMAGGVT
jgi:hypothetical protein